MKDCYNNELKVGDLVVYGSRGIDGVTLAVVTNTEKSCIYSGGLQQGRGVHGYKLVRIADEAELKACPYNKTFVAEYEKLMQTARKWTES